MRHAAVGEPFHEQQIVRLCVWSGGPGFAIGQACKKALESQRLPTDAAVAELLGAINYLAAAVIVRERMQRPTYPPCGVPAHLVEDGLCHEEH